MKGLKVISRGDVDSPLFTVISEPYVINGRPIVLAVIEGEKDEGRVHPLDVSYLVVVDGI